jgi:DNA-binding MarR family transcriptional regulator
LSIQTYQFRLTNIADPLAPETVAAALRAGVGLLYRRLRHTPEDGELTLPERSALSRLDRGGAATSAELARLEQISPQSMGVTLASLEARRLIARAPDAKDGRRIILSLTAAGRQVLQERRSARVELLAQALAREFTAAELKQLMAAAPLLERLAESI